MVTKEMLEEYGFDSIKEWNEYIIDSYVNGQKTQAKKFFICLNHLQQKNFMQNYILDLVNNDSFNPMFKFFWNLL